MLFLGPVALAPWEHAVSLEMYDTLEQRCRRLGHSVPFRYCRQLPEGYPCGLILDCWYERIKIADFVQEHCTPAQIKRLLSPPQSKLASILEIAEQARKAAEQTGPDLSNWD